MSLILKRMAVGWLILVPLVMCLGALTYSGPYRWLCEWQASATEEESPLMFAGVPALLLMMPAFLYLRRYLPKETPPPTPLDPAVAEKKARRILGVVGLGGTAICAGALLWAQQLPDRSGPAVDVDLATLGGAAPPTGHVILIGRIDTRHVARISMSGKVAIHNERNLYAPLTASGAVTGPARIFVTQYVDGATTEPLPTAAGNRFDGVLMRDGLPTRVLRTFGRMGVEVADPHYLLFTSREGARVNAHVVAGLSGFVAFLALLPLALMRLARRRAGLGS